MRKWLWLLLLLTTRVSAVEISPYIVNGTNANVANYPSFASLAIYISPYQYSSGTYCGATVLNSRYILTAAHCIYGNSYTMLYTVVVPQLEDESQFPNGNVQFARAAEFYYPDNYVDSSAVYWPNDIAIIKLESDLNVSNFVGVLNSSINNSYDVNGTYKAIGHGYVNGNVAGGTRLLETTLTFVPFATCSAYYGANLGSGHVCFTGPQIGSYRNSTCSGDSGGPVYLDSGSGYVQIGITSFGPSTCGNPALPVTSVFTEVSDYYSWILRVMNGLETPKYYVTESNGVRQLVAGGTTVSPVTSSDSGGSSTGLALLVLGLLMVLRNKNGLYQDCWKS
ncbi:TPA: GlyGly-anchored extracellular serine protease VesA [Vibrio cholerae]|uniref:GlyGly-anchored extracellular serine protease VesA n=1 Tax=Vibrio cholerae TaxID=666 RepID=UPI00053C835C|nr:GlyGly-anchored extracellular serine protease VesA [Vibrio cholerae]EGQ8648653.1 GlyGly-anchored extracellular serine protease VesA [Vibrio cholerae]EGR0419065.1 GlyGly-anchored extracellular serine protease VesA [Vibrio cholerae]EGR0442242.1 GlyGly-anchored extracellular serine protease VesA [Vibrio cholerae]EGR0450942.1 GlyGly-anchored extracellular serine protease VesA [Vibrio cholerae]EGR0489468.1 GlyGly-anchored extracellular serine protease VesA [Vibrio cholerae]